MVAVVAGRGWWFLCVLLLAVEAELLGCLAAAVAGRLAPTTTGARVDGLK